MELHAIEKRTFTVGKIGSMSIIMDTVIIALPEIPILKKVLRNIILEPETN
jgi:hypothetical protein